MSRGSSAASIDELIVYLAKALVDEPESVRVQAVEEGNTMVYELSVAPTDLGKVIGREGRTARALRMLVSSAAAKQRQRTILQIVE